MSLCACTTYKADNHSVKYTTNYNTNISPSKNGDSSLASSDEFKNPEETSLDEVSPFVPKPFLKKGPVVRTYVEPTRQYPSAVVPMAGVAPFSRNHWMHRDSNFGAPPQLYFYGY